MNDLALAISGAELPAHLNLDSSRGNESVGSQLTIPRIKLIQKMSNEVDKNHADFVKGAEVGMFVNTLTKQTYEEMYVISLNFKVQYAVWRDIQKGGGFGGTFDNEADALESVKNQDNPAEWDVVENHSHLIAVVDEETGELGQTPVIFDFTKSKLATSRSWNSKLSLQSGDRFASLWKITSKSTQSRTGQQYENLDVDLVGWATEDNYKAAEKMYETHSTIR